ncbi:MAG: 16S rRNA (uracil(1498)-N(3))-methyltransferase [Variibacter sp.]
MPAYDFTGPRLFVEAALQPGAEIPLEKGPAHYLTHVLRLQAGAELLAFNGRDGEWRVRLAGGKKSAALILLEQTRPQTVAPNLHYLFAPLKHARLDYMVQKAVEMGAAALQPVLTQHTQVTRINRERMRANAIEAAEQCGVLTLPEIGEPTPLAAAVAALAAERVLIFCDERADVSDPIAALAAVRTSPPAPLAVLIGPEGGFSVAERELLLRRSRVVRLALGPRILRADTAAVAALALVQAVLGDWASQ